MLQGVEAPLPELAVRGRPLRGFAQGPGIERAVVLAATHLTLDKAGSLQQLEMLRYRVQRHVERSRDVGDPEGSLSQSSQDGPARLIGESRERPAEPGLGMFNHKVEHIEYPMPMSRARARARVRARRQRVPRVSRPGPVHEARLPAHRDE